MGGWGGVRGTGRRRSWAAAALLTALAALLPGCATDRGSRAIPSPSVPASSRGAGPVTYVSIGDSYAAGYQPIAGQLIGKTSTSGYAYQLVKRATLRGAHLSVVNFACGGETSTALLEQKQCFHFLQGPGTPAYDGQTQAAAALGYIRQHRAQVGLVTISIGGNDVIGCSGGTNIIPCLRSHVPTLTANLRRFLTELRAAAAPDVTIVGITYPDVLLGGDVFNTPEATKLAADSVVGFENVLNPALKATYAAAGATFVDVTAATGAYVPMARTTVLAPFGRIPVSVARVCQLTYYCELQDIHPRDNGYRLIADLIARVLPK